MNGYLGRQKMTASVAAKSSIYLNKSTASLGAVLF